MPEIDQLLEVMRRLRAPDGGCPWDREQTPATIAPFTIEEAYEVEDAISRGDVGDLVDELGDLLFQVVFYAQIGAEEGSFDFSDVVEAIVTKMVRRHPHVFADAQVASAQAQSHAWEAAKTAERDARADGAGAPSRLDGVAIGLPATTRAAKLQKRAAHAGFDWDGPAAVLPKLREELAELGAELDADAIRPERVMEEVGDVLFTAVNLARHLDVDPESALRLTNRKFERRFRSMERVAERDLSTLDADELEALWESAKREEHAR